MKTPRIMLAVVLLGLLSCTKENPLNELLAGRLPAASSDGQGPTSSGGRALKSLVPFKGTFKTLSILMDPPRYLLRITGTG